MPSVSNLRVRPIAATDDIEVLTGMLHRAYAVLGAAGMNYTAVDQTAEVTRARLNSGLSLVAVDAAEKIVGTITYHPPGKKGGTPWLARADVAHFAQFAVEPEYQGSGVGALLLGHVEEQAKADGGAEIALDTAEPAHALIGWYTKRGYRFIEHAQWQGKHYRSLILSKTL
jgi:GNAT superfamily N-acetyltransferase